MKTITEYTSISSKGVKVITKEEAELNTTDNIYYLHGVRADKDYNNGVRAKDEDIILKDMFVIDVDIRNNFKDRYQEECTNEEIINEGKNIIKNLEKEDELFGEWQQIVFTGNGLHIIYKGIPDTFTKEEYSMGVNRIYRQWDILWGNEIYQADRACKNLARILRLPGSINQKNGAKVSILAERGKESRLFNLIKGFAKKEKEELEKEKELQRQKIAEQLKQFEGEDNEEYKRINQLPAYMVAQWILPEFPYDGKRNFRNNKGGFTGYFYNQSTNTICNGGSRYFNNGDASSCYNCFSLMKNHNNWTNAQTFNFFKHQKQGTI